MLPMLCEIYLFGQTPHQRGKAMGFELYPATLERNHHPQVNLVNQTIVKKNSVSSGSHPQVNLVTQSVSRVTSSYVGKEDKKSVVQKVIHNLMEFVIFLSYFCLF